MAGILRAERAVAFRTGCDVLYQYQLFLHALVKFVLTFESLEAFRSRTFRTLQRATIWPVLRRLLRLSRLFV